MQFVTVRVGEQKKIGLLSKDGREISLLAAPKVTDMFDVIQLEEAEVKELADQTGEKVEAANVVWCPPLERPRKNIFCIGKNYADHARELASGADLPEYPVVFTKPPTSVSAHEQVIPLHYTVTSQLDYEGELAVVIGKKGKNITRENAEQYIFGYTILNDMTARDLQKRHQQYFLGKSLDGSCPLGPALVHRSAVGPAENLSLTIETKVNGEIRQQASTKQMIFDIPALIETLSRGMTLEPGDVIATGTPAGVGAGQNPPRFLQDGDVIEITIDKIGTLRNKVAKEMQ